MAEISRSNSKYHLATGAGILSILLWSCTIAFAKSAMNKEGDLNAAFYIYFYSGIAVFLVLALFNKQTLFFRKIKNLSASYYYTAGIFFVLNNVLLFFAVSLANKDEELLIVTMLNYTWPVMIYVVRIFMFRVKIPVLAFISGVILSLVGISLALIEGSSGDSFSRVLHAVKFNVLAYSLAFLTSISWALYSNLTARSKSRDDLSGIPFILLISSLVFLLMQYFRGQISGIQLSAITNNPGLVFIILGPTTMAYLFWYFAIKNGNKTLVTALSLFIPLFSILIMHVKLHLRINATFWIATILLISGSYICYKSFVKSDVNTHIFK